jgi:hypothetical protein
VNGPITAYGIFHFSGRRYDIKNLKNTSLKAVMVVFSRCSFRFSKFQRIEAGISIANSDKQIIAGFLERKALPVKQ